MFPTEFKESNAKFGPPKDLEESQCMTIPAFVGTVVGGSCDGSQQVIVAWKPSVEDMEVLSAGGTIYVSMLGGLPPHFLTTNFDQARKPA